MLRLAPAASGMFSTSLGSNCSILLLDCDIKPLHTPGQQIGRTKLSRQKRRPLSKHFKTSLAWTVCQQAGLHRSGLSTMQQHRLNVPHSELHAIAWQGPAAAYPPTLPGVRACPRAARPLLAPLPRAGLPLLAPLPPAAWAVPAVSAVVLDRAARAAARVVRLVEGAAP